MTYKLVGITVVVHIVLGIWDLQILGGVEAVFAQKISVIIQLYYLFIFMVALCNRADRYIFAL